MHKLLWIFVFIPFSFISAQTDYRPPAKGEIDQKIKALPSHPRLLFLKNAENSLHQQLERDHFRRNLHQAILAESEALLSVPPVERIQIGRRLLDKSRECLRRVFLLAYSYRMTGDERFLKRTEKELVAVSEFSDWNPSHFLDVAEMTMAVAIGYDWLYDHLSQDTKQKIRTAILEKGIRPSYDRRYNNFLRVENNWNQVCNAGMTFGALAIAEDEPELASQTIHRALETTPKSMFPYAPDGAYPEGYGYWGYGTSFNVLLINALEVALGTDYGLSSIPGFLKTGGFLQNMIGPMGLVHNWGDSGLKAGLNPALLWFASKTGDASMLWNQTPYLEGDQAANVRNRIIPTALFWGTDINLSQLKRPEKLIWYGQGDSPVALMRSSWTDPNAIFVGFKAGAANVNHAHMDVGSFVLDALGERWAMDFGAQSYHSLESRGIQLWGRQQNSQRWQIFRYNNRVHNTLTIDDSLHRVAGYAKIDAVAETPEFLAAVSDLSKVFEGQAQAVKRGIALANQKEVWVRDEVTAPGKAIQLRWTMLTEAQVKLLDDKTVELSKNGKKMYLIFQSEGSIKLKTWSTDPPNDYDAPNPGTTLVGFEAKVPAGKTQAFNVVFSTDKNANPNKQSLAKWPVKKL